MSKKRLSRRLRFRRRTKPGALPGTLSVDRRALPPTIEVVGFNQGKVETLQITDPQNLKVLREQWPVLWVNVTGLGDVGVIRKLGEMFGIHQLALEDVVNVHQRAKVDAYDNLLYIVVRMVARQEQFETEQVSIFLGERFVITFQEKPGDSFDPIRHQLKLETSSLRQNCRPDYLAYRLIDAVVDGYFPLLESLGDTLDQLDAQVVDQPQVEVFSAVHQLKADLLLVRRIIWPHRDALNELIRDDYPQVSNATRTYLRDVYDHVVQIIDLVETYREICGDLRDYYMSTVSNRMNEIIKVLTIISTVFIPLSFIASLYGMNFDTERSPFNMPELNWYFGYPFALSVMAVVAGVMMWFFYRRGWFSNPTPRVGTNRRREPSSVDGHRSEAAPAVNQGQNGDSKTSKRAPLSSEEARPSPATEPTGRS